jgi:hypothetical protein
MKLSAFLLGLLCVASVPAQAVTLAEAIKVLRASEFNDVWYGKDNTAMLLGSIQAGKRRFWVILTEVPKRLSPGTSRQSCRVAILEEKTGKLSYLGHYFPDCEDAFRVRGNRIEHRVVRPDGSQFWPGFALTEKGPPPNFYGGDPDLYPFSK